MIDRREKRIRGYMSSIRELTKTMQPGVALKIQNKLDKISVELKKDSWKEVGLRFIGRC